jgi:uncharacterized protein (DUF58 family)
MRHLSATSSLRVSSLAPENALRRLELHIVRRLEGYLYGEHLGLLPGPGTDLAEARPYVAGADDVRRMDWSVTARTTVPHVRDVIADRELETWALVDLSPSMSFGTAALEKRELAVAAVATIGLLTFRIGDRFGGYVLRGGTVRRWPARSGRIALYALLRALWSQPPERDSDRRGVDLPDGVRTMSRSQRKRGFRVVVSDFLDAGDGLLDSDRPPAWEHAIRELAARHQTLAVEVIDPRELDIPDVGTILMQDPESGELRELHTGSRRVRERYSAAARMQRERTRRALRRAGAGHLVLRTDRDWVADTARFTLAHRRIAQRLHAPPTGVAR